MPFDPTLSDDLHFDTVQFKTARGNKPTRLDADLRLLKMQLQESAHAMEKQHVEPVPCVMCKLHIVYDATHRSLFGMVLSEDAHDCGNCRETRERVCARDPMLPAS